MAVASVSSDLIEVDFWLWVAHVEEFQLIVHDETTALCVHMGV